MGKRKQKYYVVWRGLTPGVMTNWDDCQRAVTGFPGAAFKSFGTREEAQAAFDMGYDHYQQRQKAGNTPNTSSSKVSAPAAPPAIPAVPTSSSVPAAPQLPAAAINEALAVDAACSGNPGKMEYRGVYLRTGREVFHFGPVLGTNNIGEFLAIVHALALLKVRGLDTMPVYSDSVNAQLWVKRKKCKTTLARSPKTEVLFQTIERAEAWLRNNTWKNPIIKWPTHEWGEIPADFGRK